MPSLAKGRWAPCTSWFDWLTVAARGVVLRLSKAPVLASGSVAWFKVRMYTDLEARHSSPQEPAKRSPVSGTVI